MKQCILDGARLADAAAVYEALAAVFGFPDYFGNNPDALWDALGDYNGEPVAVLWRNAALSEARLGTEFQRIVVVLQQAVAAGRLAFELE